MMRERTYIETHIIRVFEQINIQLKIKKPTMYDKVNAILGFQGKYLDKLNESGKPEAARDFHTVVVMHDILSSLIRKEISIHTVAERFGLHLNRTTIDVSCEHLLKCGKEPFYVEFPKSLDLKSVEGKRYECAMITYGTVKERKQGTDLLMIVLPETPDYSNPDSVSADYYYMPINPDQTVSDAIGGLETILDKPVPPDTRKAIAFAAKCLLYKHSGEPDLVQDLVVEPRTKNYTNLKKHWMKFCFFKVAKLGYSFHGRNYHTDSTEVCGHFRWQPCGVGKQYLKLIWISEHIRQYNKHNVPRT
jgi:hypothetical protein